MKDDLMPTGRMEVRRTIRLETPNRWLGRAALEQSVDTEETNEPPVGPERRRIRPTHRAPIQNASLMDV